MMNEIQAEHKRLIKEVELLHDLIKKIVEHVMKNETSPLPILKFIKQEIKNLEDND